MAQLQQKLLDKENHWSSVLERCQSKIEKLKAHNQELQADLHMMEQERLLWWQQQVQYILTLSDETHLLFQFTVSCVTVL